MLIVKKFLNTVADHRFFTPDKLTTIKMYLLKCERKKNLILNEKKIYLTCFFFQTNKSLICLENNLNYLCKKKKVTTMSADMV